MELVKGVPITRYCDEHHLTPKERLDLFIPVCQAVQHAHQKGIIHRDLKPSNVLVAQYDGKPVPKIIDFGVAKATGLKLTEATLFTAFGQVVGTFEYMSPEQAELNQLDIDTRSDIYSLGVLLYELLTGTTPMEHKRLKELPILEVLRRIREEEPPKPSTRLGTTEELPSIAANRGLEPKKLSGLVKGELDWIVMKCLEKDRNRRYETANGLAMDLQRYLADEPVAAGPPSAAYRLRKFLRRNKGPVLAASLVFLALVVGIIGTTWAMFRATAAEADAAQEATQKATALGEKESALAAAQASEKQALENLKDSLAAVDQMLTRVGHERLAHVPQMEQIRRDLLQDAIKFYEKFLQNRKDDPQLRRETADAYGRLAGIYNLLGQHAEAERAYRKCISMLEALVKEFPQDADCRAKLIEMRIDFGWSFSFSERSEDMAETWHQALKEAEQLVEEYPTSRPYKDRLAAASLAVCFVLAKTEPVRAELLIRRAVKHYEETGDQYRVGHSWHYLSYVLGAAGKAQQAEDASRKALTSLDRYYAANRSDSPALRGYALNQLAALLKASGRLEPAKQAYRDAQTIWQKLAADFPTVPEYRVNLATSHINLGSVARAAKQDQAAEAAFRQAVAIMDKVVVDFPTVLHHQKSLHTTRADLGMLLVKAGRMQEAQDVYTRAFAVDQRVLANLPTKLQHWQELANSHIELARMLAAAGRAADADAAYRQAVAIQDKLEADHGGKPEFRRDLAAGHRFVAGALPNDRRREDAEKLLRLAVAHYEKLVAEQPGATEDLRSLADTHFGLGQRLYTHAPRERETEAAWRRAIESYRKLILQNSTPEAQRYLGGSLSSLAQVLVWTGQAGEADRTYREAEQVYREVLPQFEKLAAASPEVTHHRWVTADCRYWLAKALMHSGRRPEAAEVLKEAAAIWEKMVAEHNIAEYRSNLCATYGDLGNVLREMGRFSEAEKAFRRQVNLLTTLVADTPAAVSDRLWLANAQQGLGSILKELKRFPEAETAHREALVQFEKLAADFPAAVAAYRLRWANQQVELGHLLQELKRSAEAYAAYSDARKTLEKLADDLPPDDPAGLFTSIVVLGGFLEEQGRGPEAEKLLTRAQELYERTPGLKDSTNPWVHNNLAWTLVRDGRLPPCVAAIALPLARRGVELGPSNGAILNTLGTAFYRAGDWQAAIETLKHADELDGADHFSHNAFFIAMAHWQLGEKDQARKWYAAALVWMQKRLSAHETLIRFRAEAAGLLGLSEELTPEQVEAVKDEAKFLSLVLDADPGVGWASYARAVLHRSRGEHEKADADLRRALENYSQLIDRDPKAWPSWAHRGDIHAELGQWKEAATDLAKAAELAPKLIVLKYRQALCRLGQGDKDGYRKLCGEMLDRSGQEPEAAYWTAWTCVLAADAAAEPARFVQLAESASARHQGEFDYLNTLGAACFRAGRVDDALKNLSQAEAALKAKPDPRQAVAYNWFYLAMTHHRLGRAEEARQWLARAVEESGRMLKEGPKNPASPNAFEPAVPWNRRLTLELLRREAEAMINGGR